jgi:hypothetical protein
VLPPEIFLESTRVSQFNEEDQAEAREIDSNLLEEKHNKALANMQKYQGPLKHYYNKSVVPKELKIGDLVLNKDIRVTPLVFTIAGNVYSTVLHLVIAADLWKWDLV